MTQSREKRSLSTTDSLQRQAPTERMFGATFASSWTPRRSRHEREIPGKYIVDGNVGECRESFWKLTHRNQRKPLRVESERGVTQICLKKEGQMAKLKKYPVQRTQGINLWHSAPDIILSFSIP